MRPSLWIHFAESIEVDAVRTTLGAKAFDSLPPGDIDLVVEEAGGSFVVSNVRATLAGQMETPLPAVASRLGGPPKGGIELVLSRDRESGPLALSAAEKLLERWRGVASAALSHVLDADDFASRPDITILSSCVTLYFAAHVDLEALVRAERDALLLAAPEGDSADPQRPGADPRRVALVELPRGEVTVRETRTPFVPRDEYALWCAHRARARARLEAEPVSIFELTFDLDADDAEGEVALVALCARLLGRHRGVASCVTSTVLELDDLRRLRRRGYDVFLEG